MKHVLLSPGDSALDKGKILLGDARLRLSDIPAEYVDLILTSPPYDKQRNYDGYSFEFKPIAQELTRVLKPGGVIVWVVADATISGSESLSSLRQALYFKDKCKLRVHDTMIFAKNNPMPGDHGPRYRGAFEYMFAFSKGKPNTFNPITWKAKDKVKFAERFRLEANGRRTLAPAPENGSVLKDIAERTHPNIFFYTIAARKKRKIEGEEKHPAVFPDQLAEDQIRTWTNPGDVVLDPFLGSGTSGRLATLLDRKFLGIEISPKYCLLAKENIEAVEAMPIFAEEESPAEELIPLDLK
jgi:DNA modification methylase